MESLDEKGRFEVMRNIRESALPPDKRHLHSMVLVDHFGMHDRERQVLLVLLMNFVVKLSNSHLFAKQYSVQFNHYSVVPSAFIIAAEMRSYAICRGQSCK